MPSGDRNFDVLSLALLRSAPQQDYQALAVLTEIDTVARTEIDTSLEHPCAKRVNAVTTLAAGCGSRWLNQTA